MLNFKIGKMKCWKFGKKSSDKFEKCWKFESGKMKCWNIYKHFVGKMKIILEILKSTKFVDFVEQITNIQTNVNKS